MSFGRGRGRGRGRGGGGFSFGGGGRNAKQLPFELFPEIECLGVAKYSEANIQLVKWSLSLQKEWSSSPYYYEDRNKRSEKVQKPDIERYSDRNSTATKAKPPLWHFIKLDPDHVPAELARGDKTEKHVAKKVRWNPELDLKKLDLFEKLEKNYEAHEGKEKKDKDKEKEEEEGEGEDGEKVEEEGEFSDEGDYEQGEYCDDDEDDYNMADDGDDEPFY